MRKDLVCIPRVINGELRWVIKDPIRLSYFSYPEESFFVLQALDGNSGIAEIQKKYARNFQTGLTEDGIQTLISMFVRDQLVIQVAENDGDRMQRIGNAHARRHRFSFIANPLAVRFPGWNLTSHFSNMKPLAELLVRPITMWCILIFAAASAGLVLSRWSEFQARLPLATEFFALENVFWMLGCLAVTKIIHEYAHGLTCVRFGAECHEVGVMLLVFTPCMYCDVSDAWMIESKWKRIAIASAGILVELFLAAVATLLWWLSEPGFLNNLCLNLMFICGISTVLLNGNPLLRYDGYFVLSDFVDIPNLWMRSREAAGNLVNKWVWGVSSPQQDRERNEIFLVLYGICSIVYRAAIVILIAAFIASVLIAVHLRVLAIAITVAAFFSLFLRPPIRVGRRVLAMAWHGKIRQHRVGIAIMMLLLFLAIVFFVPFPHRTTLPGYLELADAKRVYVRSGGQLQQFLPYGSQVKRNQTIAELTNPDLQMTYIQLKSRLEQKEAHLEKMEALQIQDKSFGSRIPAEKELLSGLRIQVANLKTRLEQLKLSVEQGGLLVSPGYAIEQNRNNELILPNRMDWPLLEKNMGCWLEKGEVVGIVGDPNRLDAFALIRQESVDLVQPGQTAKVLTSDSTGSVLTGEVINVSILKQIELPSDLLKFLEARYGSIIKSSEIESGKIYLARIRIENANVAGLQFESAKIKIRTRNSTLANRVYRYLRRTFQSLSG